MGWVGGGHEGWRARVACWWAEACRPGRRGGIKDCVCVCKSCMCPPSFLPVCKLAGGGGEGGVYGVLERPQAQAQVVMNVRRPGVRASRWGPARRLRPSVVVFSSLGPGGTSD